MIIDLFKIKMWGRCDCCMYGTYESYGCIIGYPRPYPNPRPDPPIRVTVNFR